MTRNLTIHGLRGLAAILVVLYHIYKMGQTGGFFSEKPVEGFFKIYYNFGSMGVNIFFMISGFLIIGSLSRYFDIKSFLINRIIRIYPVFLTLHLIVFLMGPIINYEWLGSVSTKEYLEGFFVNLFLLPGIFDLPLAQKNAWSLSYEFTFYVISSLFFYSIYKMEKGIFQKIFISMLICITFIIFYNHPTAIFFVIGVCIYYCYKHLKSKYTYKKYYILNGLVLLPTTFFLYDPKDSIAILPLILSGWLFWTVVNEEGILSKILKRRSFQYLGNISYSLYLIHPFAMFPLKVIFSTEKIKNLIGNEYLSIGLFGVLSIIGAIIASHVSYVLIEVWFTNKMKTRLNSRLANKSDSLKTKTL
ncbi:acyltransferase family protein [Bacillus anthracis]|uniref:acyltransferase family protein n=1 Tax=Bacillus anthracis TaxID=1392 RepID=UPI003B9F79A0